MYADAIQATTGTTGRARPGDATNVRNGTVLLVYYLDVARLHQLPAKIHQLVIFGQRKHQARRLGARQHHTVAILLKAAIRIGIYRILTSSKRF